LQQPINSNRAQAANMAAQVWMHNTVNHRQQEQLPMEERHREEWQINPKVKRLTSLLL
jgi:hypothetical protein